MGGGGGGGANISTPLLKKMLTGPLNSLFRKPSQRSGDRKEKRHGKRAEATLNSPAEAKRVNKTLCLVNMRLYRFRVKHTKC